MSIKAPTSSFSDLGPEKLRDAVPEALLRTDDDLLREIFVVRHRMFLRRWERLDAWDWWDWWVEEED